MKLKYDKNFLTSLVDVQPNDIVAKKPLYIVINKDEHKELLDTGDSYQLIGTFKICDKSTDKCTLTPFIFQVQIPKNGDIETNGNEIKISFDANDVIMKADYKVLESDLQAIRSILENRIKYFRVDIAQQITVLEELFSGIIGSVPLVYFELILSELYRCSDDESKAVRLCGGDYGAAKPVDIKRAIHLNGTLNRAISYGYSKEALATNISSTHVHKKDSLLDAVSSKQ